MSPQEIVTYHKNGNVFEKYFTVNGVLHGKYEQWYDDGQQAVVCTYVIGLFDGKYEGWYTIIPTDENRLNVLM